jgi:uncharacterized cupredoxin-like copper-binding protein
MKHTRRTHHFIGAVSSVALAAAVSVAWAHGSAPKEHDHTMNPDHLMRMDVDYADVEEHAFGKASDPANAVKTIEVDMHDGLRFEPAMIEVRRGETIRFVVRNSGKLLHEMVLGTEESLHQHAILMKKYPGMEHSEPHMAHVGPGGALEMGWQFTEAGEFFFGCLVPGHYDGGMKGRILVRPLESS